MRRFLRRLLGLEATPAPKLVTIANRQDELEERVEYLGLELKRLRGRITGAERKKSLEDEPGEEISEEPAPQHPPLSLAARRRAARGF